MFWFQNIGASDHVGELAEAELGHQFAHFLGNELHEIHSVIGITSEFFAQLRILRGDADGASIEMANAHHDTTE